MSESPNSHPKTTEATADLSQNLDEILDLELSLGAIGGLRHSAACAATERSQRRYDERNHRLHESRMESLGMKGGESPEVEDMAQQVLIRSPITHNHYPPEPTPAQPVEAKKPEGMSTAAKVATSLAAATLFGPGGVWMASLLGAFDKPATPTPTPPAVESIDTDTDTVPMVIIHPRKP